MKSHIDSISAMQWDVELVGDSNESRIRPDRIEHGIDADECSRRKVFGGGLVQPVKRLLIISQAKVNQHKLLCPNVAEMLQLGEHFVCAVFIAFEGVGVT